jgi:hypothetical protein
VVCLTLDRDSYTALIANLGELRKSYEDLAAPKKEDSAMEELKLKVHSTIRGTLNGE